MTTASEGNGTTYPTMEQAVLAMFDEINTFYANRDKRLKAKEYGGDIREAIDENGRPYFFYDSIEIGSSSEVGIRVKEDAVAWVHSHPPERDRDMNLKNRKLSSGDINRLRFIAERFRPVTAYIADPFGAIRRFHPGKYGTRGEVITEKEYVKYD